jgi:U3 small nucleolar RNA-associated protein 5
MLLIANLPPSRASPVLRRPYRPTQLLQSPTSLPYHFTLNPNVAGPILIMSTKRKFNAKLGQPSVKPSAKPATKEYLNDSRAVVSRGGYPDQASVNGSQDIVEISSDSEDSSSNEEEDEDGDESDAEQDVPRISKEVEGVDVDMKDVGDRDATAQLPNETEEPIEPSFGDLVLANSSEPIDVADAFNDSNFQTLSYPQSNKLQPPSGASLGTVLTQALKTNDLALLESCLQTPDTSTIRATIQRLDSPLAGSLLQKLAERLHRRPGRAGSLMVWVQWTLVTHGGYLATQPDLIKRLAELNRVIDERARGLQSLLSLKGKLDMLEAQMQLRQSMRQQRRDLDDEDDEEGVIYVEGEEGDSSENDGQNRIVTNGARPSLRRNQPNGDASADESEVSEDMPTNANGIIGDSEQDSDASDNLIDDEAEETDAESDDEDEVDHSDVDEIEEEDDSDDAAPARAAPPSKMQKVSGLFSRSRH